MPAGQQYTTYEPPAGISAVIDWCTVTFYPAMLPDDVHECPDTGILTGRVYLADEYEQAHADAAAREAIRRAILADIRRTCSIDNGEWSEMRNPILNYDEGWRCGNIILCADRSDTPLLTESDDPRRVMRRNKGVLLVVTGSACREIDVRLRQAIDADARDGVASMESRFRAGGGPRDWQEWAGEITQCLGFRHVTRMDVAIDVFDPAGAEWQAEHDELTPRAVRLALMGGDFTTHLKRGGDYDVPGTWEEGAYGNTQYLGGTKSLRRLCLYDKGGEQKAKGRQDLEGARWTRWEVRLYNEAADMAFAELAACGAPAGDLVRGSLDGMIQFRAPEPGSTDRLDRQPLDTWWERFLAGVARLGYVLVTRAKTLGRQERWLCVGGAMAALATQMRVREIRDGTEAAVEWHDRMITLGLGLVDEAQARTWAGVGATA